MITHDVFQQQYHGVKEARMVLLEYCGSIQNEHFLYEHPNFGRGSIRNLLVHIVNVYEHWIANHALGKNHAYTQCEAVDSVGQVYPLFDKVDEFMMSLLQQMGSGALSNITFKRNGVAVTESPVKLFMHVITHEFHHKGQILSMSRHLGYVPVDTDIVR